MDDELYAKVLKECATNLKMAERRYRFLKSMRKDQRPIDHDIAVETWGKAIADYKQTTK